MSQHKDIAAATGPSARGVNKTPPIILEKNRRKIRQEIAALRDDMGLPPNRAVDERLARAETADMPEAV